MKNANLTLANSDYIDSLSELFDQYRVFYGQLSDFEAAKRFLQDRFQKSDSVIFMASDNGHIVGFIQLYPSYSSVAMKPIWILNDLFIKESYRSKGVATLLIDTAKKHADVTSAARIVLATQTSNIPAQRLYESAGFLKDEEYYHYLLII